MKAWLVFSYQPAARNLELVLHPVLMSWAVITTANHYLLDVVIGVATLVLAIGVLQIVDRMRTRQEHESA